MVDTSQQRAALSQLALKSQRAIEDVQSRHDERKIYIDQVGVNDIKFPVRVLNRDGQIQHTVAQVSMAVDLPHDVKGTHLSRFIEILNTYEGALSIHSLGDVLNILKERLGANNARIEAKFPYFVNRAAPVSGMESMLDYHCSLSGQAKGASDDFKLAVEVPVTSLCPCSKEISDYGAHNQRGTLTINVKSLRDSDGRPMNIAIEELIEIAEKSASCPVYPLLKRPDERFVTMQAYDNPVFVEDMVREAAALLKGDDRVKWFSVQAVNHESIHNHNAFARVEWNNQQV